MSKKPKMEAALQFRLSEQNHILTYYTLNWQCPQAISKITSGRETVSISILTDVNCRNNTIRWISNFYRQFLTWTGVAMPKLLLDYVWPPQSSMGLFRGSFKSSAQLVRRHLIHYIMTMSINTYVLPQWGKTPHKGALIHDYKGHKP